MADTPKIRYKTIRVAEETYEKIRTMAFKERLTIKDLIKKLVDKAK